ESHRGGEAGVEGKAQGPHRTRVREGRSNTAIGVGSTASNGKSPAHR
ncbi:MAG: hypothetical protein ACJAZO_001843, partial [Myxococcota bacterium]